MHGETVKYVCANFTKHQMHETVYWALQIYCCTKLCALRALKDNHFTHPCLKEGTRFHHGFWSDLHARPEMTEVSVKKIGRLWTHMKGLQFTFTKCLLLSRSASSANADSQVTGCSDGNMHG